jgi:hypothetical protein
MALDWSWWAFGLGVVIGAGLAWIAGVVAMAGGESDREEQAADDQGREHWR